MSTTKELLGIATILAVKHQDEPATKALLARIWNVGPSCEQLGAKIIAALDTQGQCWLKGL